MQAKVHSPAYRGGVWSAGSTAVVNPARLAWDLTDAARRKGVRIVEGTRLTGMQRDGSGMRVATNGATIHARRVLLATGAGPSPVRTLKHYIAPVYDYVLVTEPLTSTQQADIGWNDFAGIGDAGNQFHYYRRTRDGRILWGGYDAIYHRGNGFGPQHDVDREAFGRLAQHFFATFPQLEGLRFTHGWGGAIDTCSRFAAFWGLAHSGRVSYVAGYTGLGVGTSRFGAEVALDLLDGIDSPATRLSMVRTKPLPFPPEPARSVGIDLMKRALAQADEHDGHRNLWLRAMDRLGLGFDS
jgi:glycine/D-amino acid oxidase-like deaminating enzyme